MVALESTLKGGVRLSGDLVGVGACFVHGGVFLFDVDTVLTVWIDPQTGRPPADRDPVAMDRSHQHPICPECARKLNVARLRTGRAPLPGMENDEALP